MIGSSGRWGQDRTIPEFLEENVIHDPFKVDICQLGNVFGRIVKVGDSFSSSIQHSYKPSHLRITKVSRRCSHLSKQ